MKYLDDEEEFHRQERKLKRKPSSKKTGRKKEIPPHLSRGRVVSIGGEGIWVELEEARHLCSLRGALKKEKTLTKNLVAIGDWVYFSPKEASIVSIEDRSSCLTRTDIRGKKEQLIAANVDQVIIVTASNSLKPALIDRYLIAAEKGNLHPIIAINKIDLLQDQEAYRAFLSAYEPLGLPILSLSAVTKVGMEALRSLLQNKTSVFSGQSGVGKSSLLNSCFGFKLKIGDLAAKTQKGTHTTSTAQLLSLPGGGYCVDTPGIRSFGIWNLQKEDISAHFRDIASFASHCKFPDCMHINEPSCAVLAALGKKKIPLLRYESYKSLLEEILMGSDKQTWS